MPQFLPRFQEVTDAGQEQFSAERLSHIGVGTRVESLHLLLLRTACGEQDDGDVAGDIVVLYLPAELQSVHDGHHNVGDDDVGNALMGQPQSALTVGGLHDIVFVGEDRAQILSHILVVVDDEHRRQIVAVFRL